MGKLTINDKLLNDNDVENISGGAVCSGIDYKGEPINLIGPYYLQSDSAAGGAQTREIATQDLKIGKYFKDGRFPPYEIVRYDKHIGWTPWSSIQLINQ